MHEICGVSAAREMDPSFALGRQTRCHILHIYAYHAKWKILDAQNLTGKKGEYSQYENEKAKIL